MDKLKRFYSKRAITIVTYFGGPLAAGYLLKKNFQTLNQPENAKKSLTIGIISTLLLLAGIFSIPESIIDKIPNALIPTIYTGIVYLIVEKVQGDGLKKHKESGGEFYSGWKAAGVGAVATVILIGIIALSAFMAGDFSNVHADYDTIRYDTQVPKFIENENKALAVFNVIETETPDYLIKELNNGIALWKENKEIVNNLSQIENLPKELLDQNTLLLKYCDLRLQHSKIVMKAISEDTNKYGDEIEKIGIEINQILEDLS